MRLGRRPTTVASGDGCGATVLEPSDTFMNSLVLPLALSDLPAGFFSKGRQELADWNQKLCSTIKHPFFWALVGVKE